MNLKQTKRKFLEGTILLSTKEKGGTPEKYTITDIIGEGGSAVCYEAVRIREGSVPETGKLKEFYPADAAIGRTRFYSMKRLEDGCLIPGAGTIRVFEEMRRNYIDTYQLLKKVIAENPKNEILKRYIQQGEILYGYHQEKEGEDDFPGEKMPTAYIWSPGVPGKGFDKYLAEIRKDPRKLPETSLRNILDVVCRLTDCIKALHTAGLMHMDIKPSNFLVQYDSDNRIDSGNISLFDINTLCSIFSDHIPEWGTEGFAAPEVLTGDVDNRSDIYSIGAMLFNALIITDEIPDGLYRDSCYPDLARLVRNSALIEASDKNSDSALMSKICTILEKCLARNPKNRYQSCTALKKDLEGAIRRFDAVKNRPAYLFDKRVSDPGIVIQKLLYEHPLYEAFPEKTGDLNVLVIGAGSYGQKFIDTALVSGQMSGVNLNITAVSDEPDDDRKAYLKFRPALTGLVNMEGSLKGKESLSCGNLEFRELSNNSGKEPELRRFGRNTNVNKKLIENLLAGGRKGKGKASFHYVFISLGDDEINRDAAILCAGMIQAPVCYAIEDREREEREAGSHRSNLCPVYIDEPVDVEVIDSSLGEMAFNTHIAWNDSLNIDVTKERKEFFEGTTPKQKYNRMSSLAYVLSVKYKLHSVGIDCDNMEEAAVLFSEQILEKRETDPSAKKKFNTLVALEHRRWMLELASDGWTAPRDENGRLRLEDCIARGSVKDMVKKTHPCMVPSTEASPLSEEEYTKDQHRKWDEGEIDPSLDELDRMSVELHRCFRKYARQIKKESLFHNPDLLFIESQISPECHEAHTAFLQFMFALKNIVNGVESYSRQYEYYHDALENSLKELPEDSRTRIKQRLKAVRQTFFPIKESNLYRNYKANDDVLIEKIPFILTYRYRRSLAMAFEDGMAQNGRNEAVFANVASATVLSPEKIHYLYFCSRASDIGLLIRKLDAALNYYGKRNVHCGISLALACLKEIPDRQREELQERLTALKEKYQSLQGNAWLENDIIFDVDSPEEAADKLIGYLEKNTIDLYDGGNPLFPYSYDNALFLGRVMDMKIPYFEFDWRNKNFARRIGCEYLCYVKEKSFIRINDMFALMNAADNRFNMPELSDDYESLWKIYTGEYLEEKDFEKSVGSWNCLCGALEKYEADQKPLARIRIPEKGACRNSRLKRFLPEYTFITVQNILQKLKEYGIAGEDSSLEKYTSQDCMLEMTADESGIQAMEKVLEQPQYLLSYYGVNVVRVRDYTGEYAEIRFNNDSVTDVSLDPDGKGMDDLMLLLRELEKENFIQRVRQNAADPGLVSFTYSSQRIKKMLTDPGAILEVYAFYDVLKTGYFDDAACGYEFRWEAGGVKNKLGLVLTKGFRSMIVECGPDTELKLDSYHKLHSIADHFGIGTVKVLLGNTWADADGTEREENRIQKSRGIQLGIKTIADEDRILHIGKTLADLMETGI